MQTPDQTNELILMKLKNTIALPKHDFKRDHFRYDSVYAIGLISVISVFYDMTLQMYNRYKKKKKRFLCQLISWHLSKK